MGDRDRGCEPWVSDAAWQCVLLNCELVYCVLLKRVTLTPLMLNPAMLTPAMLRPVMVTGKTTGKAFYILMRWAQLQPHWEVCVLSVPMNTLYLVV